MKHLLTSLTLIVLLASCTTQRKFNRIADKHEDWLLSLCISQYPTKDTVIVGKTDTLVTAEIRTDTVTTTIINTVTGKRQIVKLPCPPCKETTKTILRTDTVKVRDTRIERQLQLKLEKEKDAKIKAETLADKYKGERNTLLWIIGIGVLVVGVLKFLKLI